MIFMIRDKTKSVTALLLLGLLAGCAATGVASDVGTTGMPNPELALRRALDQVNSDMTEIGGMRPGAAVAAEKTGPVVPEELQGMVDFVWNGPLDAGVEKLAASIGYAVLVSGPPEFRPLPVAVNFSGQVLVAFRALGTQAGAAATVELDPLHHQVRVIHHV